MGRAARLVPRGLRGYQPSWLRGDVVAGATLAAVAIPEVMGYTSIAQTPIVTGLYTILFPTIFFAVLGSSRLLVVGADSATAAILSAGLLAAAIPGVTPFSPEWLAYCSFIAILCAVLLALARIFRLGFIGDFLSASVLIGFLTGVGVQVLTGQIPDMLGIPKGSGSWLQQQWDLLTSLGDIQWETAAFAAGTLLVILGLKRIAPKVPGAMIAVIGSIAISAAIDASAQGVAVVGTVPGGFPPIGLPQGISLSELTICVGIAISCTILIIAQSAATSRSFAMRRGDSVDVNRDIAGLAGANLAAGFTGTFVVNGSPTKTQILDEQKGRTQLANLTMSVIVLVVVLWLTALLADMPKAVLGAIVFLIGFDLIDLLGLRRVWRERRGEAIVAVVTAVVVCAVGVEQGIVLAIVMSVIFLLQRQYRPQAFVMAVDESGSPVYRSAVPGSQSVPGLIVFRYDADLFYANANRFVENVQHLIESAPDPVRWVVLDCSSMTDIDYTAGLSLADLVDWVHERGAHFGLSGVDPALRDTLQRFEVLDRFDGASVFADLNQAVAAFRQDRDSR